MHELGMTAGVARTLPFGCAPGKETEERCLALKRSGQLIAAELSSAGASCSSACVYALLGAKVRLVPPDARLGVHASRRVRVYPDGRVTRPAAEDHERLAETTGELKQYVHEMGVDVALIDTAFKTKFNDAHFLSRSEIVHFGIDKRAFQETRWTLVEPGLHRPSAFKLIVDARDSDVSMSLVQLTCAGHGDIRLGYMRAVGTSEISPAIIRAVGGDHYVTFARPGPALELSALDSGTWFEPRAVSAPLEFFEAAMAAGSILIVESSLRPDSPRVLKLSTAGLAEAVAVLRKSCGHQSIASILR
jgi:hypothetical protein